MLRIMEVMVCFVRYILHNDGGVFHILHDGSGDDLIQIVRIAGNYSEEEGRSVSE